MSKSQAFNATDESVNRNESGSLLALLVFVNQNPYCVVLGYAYFRVRDAGARYKRNAMAVILNMAQKSLFSGDDNGDIYYTNPDTTQK